VRTLQRKILPVLLVLLALILIYMPVAWLLISSVSTRAELLSTPIHWIPQAPTLKNYIDILSPSQGVSEVARTFRITLGNSLIVASSVDTRGTDAGIGRGLCSRPAAHAAPPGAAGRHPGHAHDPRDLVVIPMYLFATRFGLFNTR